MSIPCQHVDYAVSLLHPSVPKYLFTSSTATDGHCSACNLLDAANLARATLATCDALNIASFRLIYTGKALCSSLPFPCDVHLQCSCRCFFPPAPNVNNPRHLPTSRHPSIFSSPCVSRKAYVCLHITVEMDYRVNANDRGDIYCHHKLPIQRKCGL